MSLTKICTSFGVILGTGFGIYVGVQNFNPTKNQSDSLDDLSRNIAELLNQMSNILDFGLSTGLILGSFGFLLDYISCRPTPISSNTVFNFFKLNPPLTPLPEYIPPVNDNV